MLSKEDIKNKLGDQFGDGTTEVLLELLYPLIENLVDEYISSCASINPTCKKLLSTAECPPKDKKMKVTV